MTLYGMTSIGEAYDPANRQRYTSFGTVFSVPVARLEAYEAALYGRDSICPDFIALAVLRATIRAMSTATYIWPMIASTTAN